MLSEPSRTIQALEQQGDRLTEELRELREDMVTVDAEVVVMLEALRMAVGDDEAERIIRQAEAKAKER